MIKTLNELKTGEEGTLVSYQGGDVELRRHLLGMGFVKGATIKLEKVAPLGDPIEVNVRGYELSLRKADAETIEVEY